MPGPMDDGNDGYQDNPAAPEARLLPVQDDPETAGFWEAASRHELVIRRCGSCAAVIHLLRSYCGICGSWDTRWDPVRGEGMVHSWTVVEHQVHPAYPAPYTIVLVELHDEPSVRFITSVPGVADLIAGQPMQLTFETVEQDNVLPRPSMSRITHSGTSLRWGSTANPTTSSAAGPFDPAGCP